MMKESKSIILSSFLIILLIGSVFVSLKNFLSLREQTILTQEFNSGKWKLKWDDIKSFNDNFPSISATTLPLKTVKAYYLIKAEKYQEAIKLLHSDNSNPFLMLKESYLADIYEELKQTDSVNYYRKISFDGLPNNTRYHTKLFQTLSKERDSQNLKNAYNEVLRKEKITHKSYLYFMSLITERANMKLLRIVDSLLELYPDDEDFFNLKNQIKVGLFNHSKSDVESLEAEKYFIEENYLEAIKKYRSAIKSNPFKFQNFESLGITFLKINELDSAKKYFRNSISMNKIDSDSKSEFYLGVLLFNEGKKDSSCIYFRRSYADGYKDSFKYIRELCKPNTK